MLYFFSTEYNQRKYLLYTLGFNSTKFKSEKKPVTQTGFLEYHKIPIIHLGILQYLDLIRENTRYTLWVLTVPSLNRENARYTR